MQTTEWQMSLDCTAINNQVNNIHIACQADLASSGGGAIAPVCTPLATYGPGFEKNESIDEVRIVAICIRCNKEVKCTRRT